MPRYDYDYENDPFYVATGEPPLEIVCPCCNGEGFIGELEINRDEKGRYCSPYYTTERCPRCKGRGQIENTEKVGTTYRRLSPV
jgi:RecJ-like exonuclease